jgi:hypothetical protein
VTIPRCNVQQQAVEAGQGAASTTNRGVFTDVHLPGIAKSRKNPSPKGEAEALLKTSLPKIWSTNWHLLICPSQS